MDENYVNLSKSLDLLINSTVEDMVKFCVEDNTKSLTPLTEYCDQILKAKEEEEHTIEELKDKISEFQKNNEHIKHQLALLEKRKESLKRDKENLAEQKGYKSKHLKRVKKDHEICKTNVEKLNRHLSKDLESQSTLDRNKNELLLYKRLSGISWDFLAPAHLVKGYVSNKVNSYCKPFCFDKDTMTSTQITEALWEEIRLSSARSEE